MSTSNEERLTLLRNLLLVVSKRRSADEKVAIELVENLIKEFDPTIKFDVVDGTVSDSETPWLFASHSTFYGLEAIRDFVWQEKVLRSSESLDKVRSVA